MPSRIVFNGREYAGREEMPEDVRRAYDEALALIGRGIESADADHTVVDVRREVKLDFGGFGADAFPLRGAASPEIDAGAPEVPGLTAIAMLLAFAAGFALVLGVALMFAMGGGRAHLPGRLALAVVTLLLLGWIDRMATTLMRRREPVLRPDSPRYRRFILWSAAGLAGAAVLLFGIAWYLP